jgi:YD repeat-containing protein
LDGENDVLAFDGTRYVLTQSDGTVTAFRADGQLDHIQDPGGTRVTAGYDTHTPNNRLVSLTHSDGESLNFTWNKTGEIASVTDSNGQVTKYTYSGQNQGLRMPEGGLFGEPLRMVRAVRVLEIIGTKEARKVLEMAARGTADSHLTREAKIALEAWREEK